MEGHHKSLLLIRTGRKAGINVNNETYDKGSSSHANEERKRREKLKEAFSALRAVLPMDPEVGQKSQATVLLEAVDYICHLKWQVEQLEAFHRLHLQN
ncbi:hypothetical protein SUGI_0470590 [Cryptomeria japonica]|nr:hypothetical protein SUGI_0470590 [Cryptomeria japonica]